MEEFDSIRPYNNDEIASVKDRLLHDKEFISAIARQRIGKFEKWVSFFVHPIIRSTLKTGFKNINEVESIPKKVKRYIDRVIKKSTDGFTISGITKLDPSQAYLFVSNHRDITLDPALLNYALFINGHKTSRVAIGDNLLSKPYVADLMRLNKSFIVKRSVTAPREMLANFQTLSRYIRHSIKVDNISIWIAQSEGRAKNGIDKTQPAIIKMIAMSREKDESFSDFINKMKIVPVCISYEIDPNDSAKAKELYILNKYDAYRKGKYEDVDSITRGISGYKGNIHLSFGNQLKGEYKNPKEVATEIDNQIIGNYMLHPTNFSAYSMLYNKDPENLHKLSFSKEKKKKLFEERMGKIPKKHLDFALRIYSNAISQKEQLHLDALKSNNSI